jgi:L-arabinose isomerase
MSSLWEAVAEWQLQSGSYRVAVAGWQLATAGHHTYIGSKDSFAKMRFWELTKVNQSYERQVNQSDERERLS